MSTWGLRPPEFLKGETMTEDPNKEFDLDMDLGIPTGEILDAAPTPPAKEKPRRKPAKKPLPAEPEEAAAPVQLEEEEIDPELDRENWPVIRIDFEEGKPNYAVLSANGTMRNGQAFEHTLQIRRGDDVAVAPSVVYLLRDCVASHYVPVKDQQTGKTRMVRQERSSIPWTLVRGGKYIR